MNGFARPSRDELIELLSDGAPVSVIADIFDVKSTTAKKWMRLYGFLRLDKPAAPEHGTEKMYVHNGCRCDACKRANTEAALRNRAKRVEKRMPSDLPHNASTYNNWGCRCDVCTASWSERCRAYSQRRKSAAA